MKRVKIMMLSLLVLAMVGGALAFKAHSKFIYDYCTTPAWQSANGSLFCTTNPGSCLLVQFSTTTSRGGIIACTTTVPLGGCDATTNCRFLTRITTDD